jgi:ATP-dependent Clp protease adaptor protein ClpS
MFLMPLFQVPQLNVFEPRPPWQDGGMDDGGGAAVLERQPEKTKPPPMHQVVLLNDDYTPMEFVIAVLQEFFKKDRETAAQIMLKIHIEGKGVCGVFTPDVAATKVNVVMQAAQNSGHPLQCVSEPLDI